ncbi:hypothetical protein EVAR_18324_1 [Eumeta japonica]|uniref:Uncharacterized protein n=1 Tax=Eumeta variegata TaxID=151549 RepID=A0A4C1V938_EUMVA|nr:hypothetical protein EVAR_18324_1 [Eumeta japonica]
MSRDRGACWRRRAPPIVRAIGEGPLLRRRVRRPALFRDAEKSTGRPRPPGRRRSGCSRARTAPRARLVCESGPWLFIGVRGTRTPTRGVEDNAVTHFRVERKRRRMYVSGAYTTRVGERRGGGRREATTGWRPGYYLQPVYPGLLSLSA